MVGDSKLAYILIRTAIILLSSVAPLLIGGVIGSWYYGVELPLVIKLWAAGEVLFFCGFIWLKQRSQLMHSNPPIPSYEQRRYLVAKITDEVASPHKWLHKWFLGADVQDIYYDNVLEWVLWAFFNADCDQQSGHLEEARGYIRDMEQKWNFKLKKGYNPKVKSIRLAADTVEMYHRPLAWYMIVGVLDFIVHVRLRYASFKHHRCHSPQHHPTFPLSLATFSVTSGSSLSYWYKPPAHSPSSETMTPIVLIHGIGVGLLPFLPLLTRLTKLYPHLPIFCIENMHVSMRVVKEVPSKDEVCEGVLAMLKKEGYDKAVFLGHSLGTMSLSYLLHNPNTRPLIAGLIFLDPITFLLHLPDVAYNFLYRSPTYANEWLLYFFVAREAGIAWSLWRRFFWFEGILWKEEVNKSTHPDNAWLGRTLVVLAGADQVVPTTEVWDYLSGRAPIVHTPKTGGGKRIRKDSCWQAISNDGMEVVRYPLLDHGAVIFQRGVQHELCIKIAELCGSERKVSAWNGCLQQA